MVDLSPSASASWQKSRFSGGAAGECVEITFTHERVWVRDSKNPCGPVLGLTREGWAAFLREVRCHEFGGSRKLA